MWYTSHVTPPTHLPHSYTLNHKEYSPHPMITLGATKLPALTPNLAWIDLPRNGFASPTPMPGPESRAVPPTCAPHSPPKPDAGTCWAPTSTPTPTLSLGGGDSVRPALPGAWTWRRGVLALRLAPLSAHGPQRPGAGMRAGRQPPGSALRSGGAAGLEGRRQRRTLAPATPGVPEQEGISRTASLIP